MPEFCVQCGAEVAKKETSLGDVMWAEIVDGVPKYFSCVIGGRQTAFKHRLDAPRNLADRAGVEEWLDT